MMVCYAVRGRGPVYGAVTSCRYNGMTQTRGACVNPFFSCSLQLPMSGGIQVGAGCVRRLRDGAFDIWCCVFVLMTPYCVPLPLSA